MGINKLIRDLSSNKLNNWRVNNGDLELNDDMNKRRVARTTEQDVIKAISLKERYGL